MSGIKSCERLVRNILLKNSNNASLASKEIKEKIAEATQGEDTKKMELYMNALKTLLEITLEEAPVTAPVPVPETGDTNKEEKKMRYGGSPMVSHVLVQKTGKTLAQHQASNPKLRNGYKLDICGFDFEMVDGLPMIQNEIDDRVKDGHLCFDIRQFRTYLEAIKGIEWTLVHDDEGNVHAKWREHTVEVNPNTYFYQKFIMDPRFKVHFCQGDDLTKQTIYNYLIDAYGKKGCIILGKTKTEKAPMVLLQGKQEDFEDVLKHKFGSDPFKELTPSYSPSNYTVVYAYKKDEGDKRIGVSAVKVKYVERLKIKDIITKAKKLYPELADVNESNAWGIDVLDGPAFMNGYVFYESLKARKIATKKGKAAKKQRAFGVQMRTTVDVLGGENVHGEATSGPLEKALLVASPYWFKVACAIYDIDPESCDILQPLYNIKTQKSDWEHGNYAIRSPEDFMFLSVQQQDGTSSIGKQGQRLAVETTKALLRNKGSIMRARILKDAMDFQSHALAKILLEGKLKDHDGKKDDIILEEYSNDIFKLLFSSRGADGILRVPRVESFNNIFRTICYTYLQQHVFKCLVGEMSSYSLGIPVVDLVELWYEKQTGCPMKFVIAPPTNKLMEHYNNGEDLVLDRNPVVGSGNRQGNFIIGFNGTRDIMIQSHINQRDKFGDSDGDKDGIYFTKSVDEFYLPGHRKYKPETEGDIPEYDSICSLIRDRMHAIFQSYQDTRNVDNALRTIQVIRWIKNDPMSQEEIDDGGDFAQDKINNMKWVSAVGESSITIDELKEKFLKGYFMPKVSKLPALAKALRKDGGIEKKDKEGNDLPIRLSDMMIAICRAINNIEDTYPEYNCFSEILDELKGINFETHESEIIPLKKKSGEALRIELAKIPLAFRNKFVSDLEGFTRVIISGDSESEKPLLGNMGYGIEAHDIGERFADDPKARRLEFSDLAKRYGGWDDKTGIHHLGYIEKLCYILTVRYFAKREDPAFEKAFDSVMYMMLLNVGKKQFEYREITTQSGEHDTIKKAGGVFWIFKKSLIVRFAEFYANGDEELLDLIDKLKGIKPPAEEEDVDVEIANDDNMEDVDA